MSAAAPEGEYPAQISFYRRINSWHNEGNAGLNHKLKSEPPDSTLSYELVLR
jgi:hypothetical protein